MENTKKYLIINNIPDFIQVNQSIDIEVCVVSSLTNNLVYGERVKVFLRVLLENQEGKYEKFEIQEKVLEISGLEATTISINKTSRDVGNKRFVIQVVAIDHDDNNFHSNIKSVTSNPFFIIKYFLQILEDGIPKRWFRSLGGKDNFIEVDIQLIDENNNIVNSKVVPLLLILCYESHHVVTSQEILNISGKPLIGLNGIGKIRFRIEEVSKNHRNRKFCIKISPDYQNTDVRPIYTSPILVLSKPRNETRSKKLHQDLKYTSEYLNIQNIQSNQSNQNNLYTLNTGNNKKRSQEQDEVYLNLIFSTKKKRITQKYNVINDKNNIVVKDIGLDPNYSQNNKQQIEKLMNDVSSIYQEINKCASELTNLLSVLISNCKNIQSNLLTFNNKSKVISPAECKEEEDIEDMEEYDADDIFNNLETIIPSRKSKINNNETIIENYYDIISNDDTNNEIIENNHNPENNENNESNKLSDNENENENENETNLEPPPPLLGYSSLSSFEDFELCQAVLY